MADVSATIDAIDAALAPYEPQGSTAANSSVVGSSEQNDAAPALQQGSVSSGGNSLSFAPPEPRPLTVRPQATQTPAEKAISTIDDALASPMPDPSKPTMPVSPHPNGIDSNSPDDTWLSSVNKGLDTTLIKGLAHIPGVFGDVMDLGDYLLARGVSKFSGRPLEDVLAEQDAARKASANNPSWTKYLDPRNIFPSGAEIAAPALDRMGEYVPQSPGGKLAMTAGENAIGGLGFRGGLRSMAPNAAAGGVGGAVSDATGDPLLGMAAGIGTVAGLSGVAKGASLAARKTLGPVALGIPGGENLPIVGPAIRSARENAAAGQILSKASDPGAVKAWAASPDATPDVAGSPRTLAATVGNDPGLFQAEKILRQEPGREDFGALDRAQSNAQQDAIRSIQPSGDVFRPGAFVRDRLNAADAAAQAVEDHLTAAHNDAVAARAQGAQDYASGLKNQADADHAQLVQAFQDRHAELQQAAQDQSRVLGAHVPAEEVGTALRQAIEETRQGVKQHRRNVYDVVDPNGTLNIVAQPLARAAQEIRGNIGRYASQPEGAEAALLADASALPDVMRFRDLMDLDSRVTDAMKAERRANGETQAYRRLVQLKSATMSAIHDGVENQVAYERHGIMTGQIAPEDAMETRLRQAWNVADAAVARRNVAGYREGDLGASQGSAFISPGAGRADVSTRGGPREASSDQRVSPSSLSPNFDEGAAGRLTEAKRVEADYRQTYDNPIVKPILVTNGFAGQYTLPAGSIPAGAFRPGPRGFETANAFLRATNYSPEGIAALENAALNPLRRNIMPLGSISPNVLTKWRGDHESALRALDQVIPGFSDRFNDAASATQAALDFGARYRRDLADAQKEAAGRVVDLVKTREALDKADNAASAADLKARLNRINQQRAMVKNSAAADFHAQAGGKISTTEVENIVGDMLKTGTDGATRMRDLVKTASQDPEALAGLRKSGVDWIIRTHQNPDGQMKGAALIKFITANRDTLRELYPNESLSMFAAIARDIETNARWVTMTAAKGSDTTSNISPMLQKGIEEDKKHTSMLSAAQTGFLTGGPKGAAAAASLYLMNALRSAGIKSVSDLYRDAMLDPQQAKLWISKMPETPEGSKLRTLVGLIRRGTILGPVLTQHAKPTGSAPPAPLPPPPPPRQSGLLQHYSGAVR